MHGIHYHPAGHPGSGGRAGYLHRSQEHWCHHRQCSITSLLPVPGVLLVGVNQPRDRATEDDDGVHSGPVFRAAGARVLPGADVCIFGLLVCDIGLYAVLGHTG